LVFDTRWMRHPVPNEAMPTASPHAQASTAPSGAPLLSVRGLRVEIPARRGTLVALHEVSFDVQAGEILGMVGESGAGKSMTGNAIIGLLEPPLRIAAGEIWFQGQDLARLDAAALRRIRGAQIGAIFQDPLTSLNPLYTIGDMLVETIQTHLPLGRAAAEARALALLAEVGIPSAQERFRHYPHQFSGGMRQRVVIALALCANPKLIIADEPTTALDVSMQAQIITLLKRLCRDHGTAVILVTHDMGVIAETAHRVCVMYAGRLVEIGPVREVAQHPLHPYTQGLMAAIPRIGARDGPLAQIEGAMPRLDAVPAGCAFHPRCPQRFAPCDRALPRLQSVGERHEAACHLFPAAASAGAGTRPQ
jgi:peptide/nickel transport system ATP-binding protein